MNNREENQGSGLSAARLQAVLESAVDGIVTITDRGIVKSVNPAAEELFGYSAVEMIGQNVSMLMPSPYREEHDGYLSAYQKTHEAQIIGIGREVEGLRKDGSRFPLYLAVSEVIYEGRRTYTGFLHDLTELKRVEKELSLLNAELEQRVEERTRALRDAQEQLVRREKLATLGQLSGGVAHEIRNPLGVIRNSVFFLKMNADQLDEEMRDCVEDIDREIDNANRIVSELLDYTREPPANTEQIPYSEVIRTALQAARVPAGVSVDTDAETESGEHQLKADRDQTERILTNLIRNAWQAMNGSGSLIIRGEAIQGRLRIRVTDTGPGIPEEDLDRVFEPLYTTKAKGIGLGLAVSRRYAERNGGTLTAESSPGNGTTFVLEVPLAGR